MTPLLRASASKPFLPSAVLASGRRSDASESASVFSKSLREQLLIRDVRDGGASPPRLDSGELTGDGPDREDSLNRPSIPVDSALSSAASSQGVSWCAAALFVGGGAGFDRVSDAGTAEGPTEAAAVVTPVPCLGASHGCDSPISPDVIASENGGIPAEIGQVMPAPVFDSVCGIETKAKTSGPESDTVAAIPNGAPVGDSQETVRSRRSLAGHQPTVTIRPPHGAQLSNGRSMQATLETVLARSNPVELSHRVDGSAASSLVSASETDTALVLGLLSGRMVDASSQRTLSERVEAWVRQSLSGLEAASHSGNLGVLHLKEGSEPGVSLRWRPIGEGEVRWLLELRVDPALPTASREEWRRLGETLATLGVRLQVSAVDQARDPLAGEGGRDWHPSRYHGQADSNSDHPDRRNSHGRKRMPWAGKELEDFSSVLSQRGDGRRIRVG